MSTEAPEMIHGELVRSTPTLGKLFEALAAAQGEMHDPAKIRTAEVGKYSYKYSDLSDLLKIIRPVFAKHGLCLAQFPVNPHRGAVTIVTRIGHKSGEWMEGDLTLLVGDDRPQTLGSSITYGRRYSAGGAAGLSPDDDEDGQVAQTAATAQQASAEDHPDFRASEKPTGGSTWSPPPNATARIQPVASVFSNNDLGAINIVNASLRGLKVPEQFWPEVRRRLHGRLISDVKEVAAEVRAGRTSDEIPF